MAEQKTSRLNVRVAVGEHDVIAQRAASAGLSISDYMRRCALQDSSRPVIRTDAEALKKVYVNLRRAGANLNQCARELNTHHRPNHIEQELALAFSAIARASEDVSQFISDARNSI